MRKTAAEKKKNPTQGHAEKPWQVKRLAVGVAKAASLNPSWQGTHRTHGVTFTELNRGRDK